MRLARDESCVLCVDMQTRMMPAIHAHATTTAQAATLARGAGLLEVPVLASRQYPKGLGETVPELDAALGDAPRYDKVTFSCCDDDDLMAAIAGTGAREIVICGVESHICVTQTALDLHARGYRAVVVADACSSRQPASHETALARLRQARVTVVTVEMVLFEWLGAAGTDTFKAVSKLVK